MMKIKYDLGFKSLIPEWKKIFALKYLKDDCISGIVVACIVTPLGLAIALASNASPVAGLIAAIIGGIVCALFGGTALAISGPAAAIAVLVASNVTKFGFQGLLFIGLICGILQLISGIFRIGSIMKFVPVPVIGGFTAGIGAIIMAGQLPRAFDIPPPAHGRVIDLILHASKLLPSVNLFALMYAVIAFVIVHFLPRFTKKLPSPLFAIIIPTVLLYVFPSDTIKIIGDIPRSLPLPAFPSFPTGDMLGLILAGFSIYFIASLETLLSSSATDRLVKGEKHDSNQELIGQGLGNIASAFFGGIPVTGLIARSALNIRAGAKTRRSSIINALVVIMFIFVFAPIIKHIPIPVLAGILFSIGVRMLDFKSFFSLFKLSRNDSYVFFITFITIVFTDLLIGVQAGLIAAAIIALIKQGNLNIFVAGDSKKTKDSHDESLVCSIEGSLTLASAVSKIEKINHRLKDLTPGKKVIIDITKLTDMDITGATSLSEMINNLESQDVKVVLHSASKDYENLLREASEEKVVPFLTTSDEQNIILEQTNKFNLKSIMTRLIYGVELFKVQNKYLNKTVLKKLLHNPNNPHTLFIACADSRVNPYMLTSTQPGELFVIRNVGNVVPSFSDKNNASESAAFEFALNVLNVKTIIVCGHANCNAVHAAHTRHTDSSVPKDSTLDKWLDHICVSEHNTPNAKFDTCVSTKQNTLKQTEQLLSYPQIKEKLEKQEIAIYAWYYNIEHSNLEIYSDKCKDFISISEFKKEMESIKS